MYKNAIEKINKFYGIDLNKNSHADEIFDVLKEITDFNSAVIFYLAPNRLTLEYGKNCKDFGDITLSDDLTKKLYNPDEPNISDDIKKVLNSKDYVLAERLKIKDAVLGILVLIRKKSLFSPDEKKIINTCAQIIAALIKDLEISKIIKLQFQTMEQGLFESHNTIETVTKQNKKIKENEKLQNQFLANVSHELRTPLNSIIGFSDALSNKIFGELNEKQTQYENDIKVSGIKLLEMINEILDITKLESHTIKLNLSDTDISLMIEEVCNTLKPLFEKKGVKVIKHINSSSHITADYIKLHQVLINILGNAIKYSPQNGKITIATTETSRNIEIRIADEGIGIPKKYHRKIFNKFFQISENTADEPSTGLGLTIAKEFIKLHGGKIEINPETDKGAEFIITIPKNYEK